MTGGSAPAPAGAESGDASRRILVLCCGQPARGDDSAAYLAAELLPRLIAGGGAHDGGPSAALPDPLRLPGAHAVEVVIRLVGQLEPDDLVDAGPGDAVVVADAVRGVSPGIVIRRDLADLASGGPSPRSSHVLPLRDVLALVVALRGALPRGRFVGIGGTAFGIGQEVSPPVDAAIPSFAEAIVAEVRSLADA